MVERTPNDIYFASLRSMIGQEKRTTLSLSTNQMQNQNNRDLVTRVFPRFRQVTCFESEFLLACYDDFLCSDWS